MKDIISLAIDSLIWLTESSLIHLLLLLCLLFLFVKEKNISHRVIFLWGSLFLFFLFLCPLSGKVLYYCMEGTYYRIFWLVPVVTLICYTATCIISRSQAIKRFLLFMLLLLCITKSGSYIFKEPNFHEVTNPYKLPQEVIDTANWLPDGAHIVGADWLVPYIRQYNPTITLVNSRWGHPVADELNKDNPDLSVLGPLLQSTNCDFVAIGQDKNMTITGNWEDYGFHFYRGDNRCIIYINENSKYFTKTSHT